MMYRFYVREKFGRTVRIFDVDEAVRVTRARAPARGLNARARARVRGTISRAGRSAVDSR